MSLQCCLIEIVYVNTNVVQIEVDTLNSQTKHARMPITLCIVSEEEGFASQAEAA
jgi:hypothetical protein